MKSGNGIVVIFDMDGTLTRPVLRFDAIREEIGLSAEPVLEAIVAMPPDERNRAEAILHRHEEEAAINSELQPRAAEVVRGVRAAGAAAVLMTRNSRRSTATVLRKHDLEFDMTWTRDDGPMKPSPEPVLRICESLGTRPDRAWVIGDFAYDILCGNAAGATTVLFLEPGRPRAAWADEADHVVAALDELPALMGLEIGVR